MDHDNKKHRFSNVEFHGFIEGFLVKGQLNGFGRQIEAFPDEKKMSVKVGYWTSESFSYTLNELPI